MYQSVNYIEYTLEDIPYYIQINEFKQVITYNYLNCIDLYYQKKKNKIK